MEKEKVGPGMFVAYSYKLYNDADGKLLFEATPEAPDVMIFGVNQEVVPGLIGAIEGLGEGDKFETTLPPAAAFGERFEENVVSLERAIFERDGKLAEEVKVGAELPMMTAEGYRILGRVLEVGDHVKMDFNHPFAGLTVRYEGKIEQVREATPEEIKPASGCGGCCGSCGDGGCGDGCSDSSCGEGGCGGCN